MKKKSVASIVAALSALGPFSVDTYFPSFPAIAEHFGVTQVQVQSTLSLYLGALAGMNLFHGALSDSFGRRRVILTSLSAYSASALCCMVAPSFGWLLGLRFLQGLAGGAGMIVGRAVIRDCFTGADAQRSMAQVTMVGGLGPVIAPIIGGWLHVWFGWRGPFCFLACLGAAFWVACWFRLPETLPEQQRTSFHPGELLRSYGDAMRRPAFLLLCLALGFGGGGFLLYVATAPDVVLNILGLSETQFGWLFGPIVAGMILGSAVSSRLAGRVPQRQLVKRGFALMSLGAILNGACNLWLTPQLPWSVLPLGVYTFGFALAAPVLTIQGLDLLPHRKGLASSLQGFTQVLIFALISGLAAPLVYRSGMKHASGLAVFMVLSWLAYGAAMRLGAHAAPNGVAAQ